MGRDTDFHFGFNADDAIDNPPPWQNGCRGQVLCASCGRFHGYCSEMGAENVQPQFSENVKQNNKGDNMPKLDRAKYGDGAGAKFLKAADIKDGQRFTIEKFDEIKTRIGLRACLRLVGTDQPLGLNNTNLDVLTDKFGDETNAWKGKKITLSKVRVNNPQTNQMQDGLRIT